MNARRLATGPRTIPPTPHDLLGEPATRDAAEPRGTVAAPASGPGPRPMLRRLALAADSGTARQALFLLTSLSGLAFWAAETGHDVNEDTLTDPALIGRYEQIGMPGSIFPVRRRVREALDRVSEAHRGVPVPARLANRNARTPARTARTTLIG